ncbi:MAG: hypothetical protein R3320_06325 [Nitriliruptorales bacterium]|nr:hypothetical protein [Nitriliruptorales bacterium]
MYTFVEHTRDVDGEPWVAIERFSREPVEFVPAPAHPLEDGRWRTSVGAGRLHHGVLLTVGNVWTLPDAWIRPIAWTPSRHREARVPLLPDFAGRLALRQYDTGLRLEVAGHYHPPLGRAGEIIDAWRLNEVAESTVADFADGIANALTSDLTTA